MGLERMRRALAVGRVHKREPLKTEEGPSSQREQLGQRPRDGKPSVGVPECRMGVVVARGRKGLACGRE